MDTICYRPYGGYRFFGWIITVLSVAVCLVYSFFPALILLIPAVFLIRFGRLTVILDETGIRLLHEKTASDRFISWDQLPCYRLDNTQRGYDMLLLSSKPMPPQVAKRFAWMPRLSTRLWFDGILLLPLSGTGNTEAVRKLAYRKCVNK